MAYLENTLEAVPDNVPCFVVSNPHASCTPAVAASLKALVVESLEVIMLLCALLSRRCVWVRAW